MSLYTRLADLPLRVQGYRLEPLARRTPAGWLRRTTVVVLYGAGSEGIGEDVTYQEEDQSAFQKTSGALRLAAETTLDGFSRRLDALDLFSGPPAEAAARHYRRWAFESAALDLALRQAKGSLAGAVGREPRPLRFVASLGLGEPPSLEPLRRRLRLNPTLEFKVDYDEAWTPALIRSLAEVPGVTTVDLKGQYRGAFRGPAGDPQRYRLVAEALPGAWLEDPEWGPQFEQALRAHLGRVTWDAPIHSVTDVERCPFLPRCLNVKPSRLGSVSELCKVYEYCEARGIEMYGGGQFEVGPGRGQAQYLASLFHPGAPNDLAPGVYNDPDLPAPLPVSPLALRPSPTGFRIE